MQRMVVGIAKEQVAQMRRGLLPYCVLALLREKERYGFDLVRTLSGVDGMVTSEGTLYPLLTRLRKQGLVTTTWQESPAGPPRRYYRLTQDGRRSLGEFAAEWARLRAGVDSLLASPVPPSTEPTEPESARSEPASTEPASTEPASPVPEGPSANEQRSGARQRR
jgi:PadR family transcriptional regulator PadR